MKNRVLMSLVTAVVIFGGLLCCIPVNQDTNASRIVEKCELQQSINNDNAYSKKSKKIEASGTGWIAQFNHEWRLKKGAPNNPYELYALQESETKAVKTVLGSMMVMPWSGCPAKFINGAAQAYVEINDNIKPIKDATVDVGGQTWYVFVFVSESGISGTFAATAKGSHGFILECATISDDLESTIDICSEFIASFRITEDGSSTPSPPQKEEEKIDIDEPKKSIML